MKSITATCVLLLGVSANVVAQSDFRTDGNGDSEASRPSTGSGQVPESALLRYEKGDAPFFVRVRVYARNLDRAITRPVESLLNAEIENLGLSMAQLEQIHGYLDGFRRSDDSYWPDAIASRCPEIAREELNNAGAREFIAQLDDREEAMNELANLALNNVAAGMGKDILDKLIARINERGETILYTRVDAVARIDLEEDGDFVSYIANQCKAL